MATKLVDEILEASGVTETRPMIRLRYQIVIASLLAQTAHIALNDKPVLSVPKTAKAYDNYDVGLTVISKVVEALEELGHLTHLPISGKRHWYEDDKARSVSLASCHNTTSTKAS